MYFDDAAMVIAAFFFGWITDALLMVLLICVFLNSQD